MAQRLEVTARGTRFHKSPVAAVSQASGHFASHNQ
jgi:hypothetical protein